MRVKVSPSKLDINPVLVGGCAIIVFLVLMKKTWFTDLPLIGSKKDNICT
jgi:hypothetical protein